MVKVVGVKFKTSSRVYYFDPLDLTFRTGDGVIVETSRGLEFGTATSETIEVEESEIVAPLKPVIRIATDEDRRLRELYSKKEPEAFAVCEQKIAEHQLDMKLVNAEYIFNGSKIVFYFTADERVDFRELVKDLAYSLRTRIELRQIGVRDEAKMLGGLGPCGRPVCCNAFLDDFRPVSIKMAKEQNLSLSPTKISGLCGRLMCCLQYEQNVYESMKKVMPKVGKEINTIDGVGTVVENNAITERTKVRLTMEDGTIDVREYPYTHLGPVGEPLPDIAHEEAAKKTEDSSDLAVMARRENPSRNSRTRKPDKNAASSAKQSDKEPGKPNKPEKPNEKQRSSQKQEKREKTADKQRSGQKRDQKGDQKQPEKKGERKPEKKGEQKQEKKGDQKQPEKKNEQKQQPKQKQNKPNEPKAGSEASDTVSTENNAPKKNDHRRRRRGKKPSQPKPNESSES